MINDELYHKLADISQPVACPVDIPYDTYMSIRRQVKLRYLRSVMRVHRRESNLKKYVRRFENGESIENIAYSLRFSPCMLARLLLQYVFKYNKKEISEIMKHPDRMPEKRWENEISTCNEVDTDCSTYIDRIRHSIGVEYEFTLHQELRNRDISFESEDALRKRGLSKTPDALLTIPFGIHLPDASFRVVNWIDSKAMFGDHESQSDNLFQLQGYVNRFGPGLVIYWFGFIESLNNDPDILMVDEFPKDICKIEDVLSLNDDLCVDPWRSAVLNQSDRISCHYRIDEKDDVPICDIVLKD